MSNKTNYDIVIIGGGPAGTICAISLKKLNPDITVCIIDRQHFPRDKACGDGLGPGVHKIINDLQLDFLFDKKESIEKLAISSPNGYELNADLPKMGDIKPLGYVIPRLQFDNDLLEQARKLGVAIYDGCELSGFSSKAYNNIEVQLKSQAQGEFIFSTKLLVGADGARSKVRRLLNIPYNSDNHTGIALRYYCKMENYQDLSLRLDFLKEINPGYGWLFPIDRTYANIGVGIDVSKLKARKLNLDIMFKHYIEYLGKSIKIDLIANSKNSYILPYGSQLPPLVNTNVILIGDAASMINPFTGEGIFYGMYAGKSLAQHVYNKLDDEKELKKALQLFETEFKGHFRKHYKINNLTKKLMGSKFSDLAIKASHKDPEILKEGIELMMGDKRSFNPKNIINIFIKGLF